MWLLTIFQQKNQISSNGFFIDFTHNSKAVFLKFQSVFSSFCQILKWKSKFCLSVIFLRFFLHQRWLIVFYWSLCDSKSHQVSRTHLSILGDVTNTVVWMVFKSSNPCTNPLVTVPITSNTVGINVTFSFLTYLSFRLLSVLFCNLPRWQRPQFGRFSFLLTITRSGRLAENYYHCMCN